MIGQVGKIETLNTGEVKISVCGDSPRKEVKTRKCRFSEAGFRSHTLDYLPPPLLASSGGGNKGGVMAIYKGRSRSDAYSPLSANWTLYKPEEVAERLGIDVEIADKALEETGFNKAVRIREELIKWKARLLCEQKELSHEITDIQRKLKKLKRRQGYIRETLINIRDILRMPREKPKQLKEEL